MVNTSKILTVSYGTFSCTLEGFDDSFETMKAIAEYFRDLAADDRYFGAEPPTPDADMLARIAEREIARRVEAHEEQGKIVLRAGEAPALAAADAATNQPAAEPLREEPAADVAAEEAPEETSEEALAEAPAAEVAEEIVEEAPAEEVAQEVAAEEFDEPAAEAQEAETPVEIDAVEAAEEFVATEDASDMAQDMPVAVPEETPVEESAEIEILSEPEAEDAPAEMTAPEMNDEDSRQDDLAAHDEAVSEQDSAEEVIETEEEFFQNSPQADVQAVYENEEAEIPVADPESVAAKLSRIRSVVSQSEQPYEADDYNEDEHAQDFLNETAADLDAALAMDDAAELDGAATSEDHTPSDAELLMSLAGKRAREIEEMDAQAEEAADIAETAELDDVDGDDGLEDTLSELLADSITAEDEAEVELASDESAPEELIDYIDEDSEEPSEDLMDAAEDDGDYVPDAAAHDPLNARVIKMSNEDFEAAISDSMAVEDGEEAMADAAEDEADDQLSPEQEEDLQRELAQVEADLLAEHAEEVVDTTADTPEAPEAVDAEEKAPVAAPEGRHKFDAADDSSDIERIFDEADSQLEKPESNQRRSAIQHLRAAVAATRAEKKAGADLQKNVDDTPYRSDLASVVRPRRPSTTEGARSERPAESRPAPLKLVAEQRVDTEQEPVRPRRVSATVDQAEKDDGAAASDSNFTEYAREMGATQLPELLEAAAAYMSDIEGRSQFSRPMLMHKLQEVEKENFSREDGLRSFGKLLRDGKIQKIKGGRFTVTDETDFRGEARHAG